MPKPPEEIRGDTAAWREDMDPLIEFFDSHFDADSQAFVSADEVTQALNEFLRSKSMNEWSSKVVAQRIGQHEGLRTQLGMRIVKDRKRINGTQYSPRFVVSGGPKTGPVTVWWGIRWSK